MQAYNLIYNPTNQFNVTFYYFPEFTLDNSTMEILDYSVENGETVEFPDSDADEQYAIRAEYKSTDLNYAIYNYKFY